MCDRHFSRKGAITGLNALLPPKRQAPSIGCADVGSGRAGCVDAVERGKGLSHDLIHVQVLIHAQPADKPHVRQTRGSSPVQPVKGLIFRPRDRVLRIAFVQRVLQ